MLPLMHCERENMIRYENRCCDCSTESYPCQGSECSLRKIPVLECDCCHEEVDELYEYGYEQLCRDCVLERLDKVEI